MPSSNNLKDFTEIDSGLLKISQPPVMDIYNKQSANKSSHKSKDVVQKHIPYAKSFSLPLWLKLSETYIGIFSYHNIRSTIPCRNNRWGTLYHPDFLHSRI